MTAHYNKIESSNNIDFAVTAITSSQYGLMLCRFKPNEAAGDMTRIKGLARGYGMHIPDDPEYGFYLFIVRRHISSIISQRLEISTSAL